MAAQETSLETLGERQVRKKNLVKHFNRWVLHCCTIHIFLF